MKVDEKYVYGHCYRPVTLSRMFDITKQDYVQRDVPCGKCYHCRMTKVNEWTTRMRLQSATYKNTYFITLTISPDAPQEVLDAHRSVKTTINANHRYCNTPICLDKATPQKFLKRMRRYYDLPSLTYFLVGEYGHKFGRPHYHAILWCDEDITLDFTPNSDNPNLVYSTDEIWKSLESKNKDLYEKSARNEEMRSYIDNYVAYKFDENMLALGYTTSYQQSKAIQQQVKEFLSEENVSTRKKQAHIDYLVTEYEEGRLTKQGFNNPFSSWTDFRLWLKSVLGSKVTQQVIDFGGKYLEYKFMPRGFRK